MRRIGQLPSDLGRALTWPNIQPPAWVSLAVFGRLVAVESLVIAPGIRGGLDPIESVPDWIRGTDGGCRTVKTRRLDGAVQAWFQQPDMAACVGADRRRHPQSRTAHCRCCVARDRTRPRPVLHELPPGSQPEPLVEPPGRALPLESTGQQLRPGWSRYHRP